MTARVTKTVQMVVLDAKDWPKTINTALSGCVKISFRRFAFWAIFSPSCGPSDGASLLIFQGSSDSIKQPILYHIESDSLKELPNFSFGSRTGNYYSCSATLNGNGLFWKNFDIDIKINNYFKFKPNIYFINNVGKRIFSLPSDRKIRENDAFWGIVYERHYKTDFDYFKLQVLQWTNMWLYSFYTISYHKYCIFSVWSA